jgi:sugar phosphate isomerase/epimerase
MRSASSPPTLSTKVRLALEALHLMDCADRAVLSTLGQASDLAEQFPQEQVGVVVDTVRLRWDPDVRRLIERAGSRIASFQVCDWILPLPADVLLARGYMGDGSIDFPPFATAVDAAGYRGNIEVEMLDADVWASPGRRHRLGRAAVARPGRSRQRSDMSTLRVAPKRSAFRLGRHGCTS